MRMRNVCAAGAVLIVLSMGSWVRGQADVLPSIPKGNISLELRPVATGLAAPDYGIAAPGDTSRLFVVEQNGLLRIIQNGTLLPGSALDLGSRVQVAPVGNGPLNPANAN